MTAFPKAFFFLLAIVCALAGLQAQAQSTGPLRLKSPKA